MANTIQAFLKRSRKSWTLLAQTAAWVAGVLAGFLLPPPAGTEDETRVWVRFAQFIITMVVGLVLLAALRWKDKDLAFRWGGVSASFLLLGTVAFFGYQLCAARWTAIYNDALVVIGSDYTPSGLEYHTEHPQLSPADLLMKFAGKVDRIWTRESIAEHRILLAGMYILTMPLFTIAIMSLLQAIQCTTSRTARSHSKPPD